MAHEYRARTVSFVPGAVAQPCLFPNSLHDTGVGAQEILLGGVILHRIIFPPLGAFTVQVYDGRLTTGAIVAAGTGGRKWSLTGAGTSSLFTASGLHATTVGFPAGLATANLLFELDANVSRDASVNLPMPNGCVIRINGTPGATDDITAVYTPMMSGATRKQAHYLGVAG